MIARNAFSTSLSRPLSWMHQYRARSILTVLSTLLVALLAGCGQAGAIQNQNSKEVPPPTATTGAATPNATLATSLTVFPVPTEMPGRQETQVARATASPYPTAMPATIKTGSPAEAVTSRGDVAIELYLAGDNFLAGENGRGQIIVRNNGDAMLFAGSIALKVTDEQGQQLEPWPIDQTAMSGWMGQDRFFDFQAPLQPGAAISRTITFQAPAWGKSSGHTYTVSAAAIFSRPDIQHPDWWDNVAIPIDTGPILLQITKPSQAQFLKAEFHADRNGYTLLVTDANGSPIQGATWGAFTTWSDAGSASGALTESPSSSWTAAWDNFLVEKGAPLDARFWVAARGYVATTISETVPAVPGYATPDPNAPFPTAVPLVTAVPTSTTPLTGADNGGQTLAEFRNRVLGTPQADPTPSTQ